MEVSRSSAEPIDVAAHLKVRVEQPLEKPLKKSIFKHLSQLVPDLKKQNPAGFG